MTKLQQELYTMLEKLVDILNDNQIKYWLAYGTTLGAIRHNGFIPWDDDVDIYIDGKDYAKLQKIFSVGEVNGLRLDDYLLCKDYPYTFPKIVNAHTKLIEKRFEHLNYISGIYIDIFPLYSVSTNKILRYIGYKYRYFNYAIVESKWAKIDSNSSKAKRIFSKILSVFNAENAQKRLYKNYCHGIKDGSVFLCEPLQFNDKHLHYFAHFNGYVDHVFEKKMMHVPIKYEEYLISQYNNYMEYPPENEKHPSHNFVYIEYSDGTIEKDDQ